MGDAPAAPTLAPLTRADLPAVAALHALAFPDSALTAFGAEAVGRYYQWLLEGPHDARLMGAWAGPLVGFCAAGVFRDAMSGFLRANRGYLALHVARHPRLWISALVRERIAAAATIMLRYSSIRRATIPRRAPRPPRSFGILSIATDPRVRGAGVGRALMADAEARARAAGFARMTLTVHPSNVRAVRFYEQLGWQRDGAEPWAGLMTRTLD